jgi:hypothetical protein
LRLRSTSSSVAARSFFSQSLADHLLQQDVALGEVELALGLGEHARRNGEDLLGCHGNLLT